MSEMIVSVCMITYNHEPFIREAIEGVLMQQTSFPIELVIGEDCSTDRTREICLEYKEKYPDKIKFLLNEKNLGMMPNFIQTLNACTGKYIALCEGDDYWTDKLKLQKQVDFLEGNEEYVMAYHDAKVIDEAGEIISEAKLPCDFKQELHEIELKKGTWVPTLSICFRNVIKSFPKEMLKVVNGDTFLISLLGQFGKGKLIYDIQPGYYRVHKGGVWSEKGKLYKLSSSINTFRYLKKYFKKKGDLEVADYYDSFAKNLADRHIFETVKKEKISEILNVYKIYFQTHGFLNNHSSFIRLNKSIGKFILTTFSKAFKVFLILFYFFSDKMSF